MPFKQHIKILAIGIIVTFADSRLFSPFLINPFLQTPFYKPLFTLPFLHSPFYTPLTLFSQMFASVEYQR